MESTTKFGWGEIISGIGFLVTVTLAARPHLSRLDDGEWRQFVFFSIAAGICLVLFVFLSSRRRSEIHKRMQHLEQQIAELEKFRAEEKAIHEGFVRLGLIKDGNTLMVPTGGHLESAAQPRVAAWIEDVAKSLHESIKVIE